MPAHGFCWLVYCPALLAEACKASDGGLRGVRDKGVAMEDYVKPIDGELVRMLLVEKDANLGQLVSGYFMARSYSVDVCTTASAALQYFNAHHYDVCIMELDLPDRPGLELLQDLLLTHQLQESTGFIAVAANATHDQVVRAFRVGCDDFVRKPFDIEELILRVEALLRRMVQRDSSDSALETLFHVGGFVFDHVRQTLTFQGHVERLTTKESDLLRLLLLHKNRLLTREQALKVVWSEYNYFNARSMDVYITKLRKRLAPDPTVEILNVRGKGFKLVD